MFEQDYTTPRFETPRPLEALPPNRKDAAVGISLWKRGSEMKFLDPFSRWRRWIKLFQGEAK